MPGLKEVKNRIASVVLTQQITKAMKMVAASKLRRAQDRVLQMRPFAKKLSDIIRQIPDTLPEEQAWHLVSRPSEQALLVVVGSDRGLCGSFNANVAKAAVAHIQERYQRLHHEGKLTILPVGRKMHDFFRKRGYCVEDRYVDVLTHLSYESVTEIAQGCIEGFKSGKYDRIDLVYNEFKNVATQIVNVDQWLPMKPDKVQGQSMGVSRDYIYQPSSEELISKLIPNVLQVKLFKALLESVVSEHGARMTAMDKATENAGDLLKELRLTYNRTRQAMITKEILEIVSGAEALKASA